MIFINAVNEAGVLTQALGKESLAELWQAKLHSIWADFEDPSTEDIELLSSLLNFHPADVRDVRQHTIHPKVAAYPDYTFLIQHRVFYNFETESCEYRDFHVFFSGRFIVTVHQHNLSRTFGTVRDRVSTHPSELLTHGTAYVLFHLLEGALKDYLPAIEEWQSSLDDIEYAVLRGSSGENVLVRILQFKKLVANIRKSLLPQRDVLQHLYGGVNPSFIGASVRPYFKAVLDDMSGLLRELEGLRTHAASVFDVYAAALTLEMTKSSHKLSIVMQRLTLLSTIFMPLTFIVGVYGMNIEGIPELRLKGFYYLLWIIMLGITTVMTFYFKRMKWI